MLTLDDRYRLMWERPAKILAPTASMIHHTLLELGLKDTPVPADAEPWGSYLERLPVLHSSALLNWRLHGTAYAKAMLALEQSRASRQRNRQHNRQQGDGKLAT